MVESADLFCCKQLISRGKLQELGLFIQNNKKKLPDADKINFTSPIIIADYIIKHVEIPRSARLRLCNFELDENQTEKFNVNIFLENSASMDGYVAGVTDFETAIYSFLSDIKVKRVGDSLNLNYINRVIPFSVKAAQTDEISDFIEKLEPNTFRMRGGNRSTSDLSDILETVLDLTSDKNVSILVSDCVFSPGTGKNAIDYVNNQSVGVKTDIGEKLRKMPDMAILVLKLSSNFRGNYFDLQNTPIPLEVKRPYYIWIIGPQAHVMKLTCEDLLESIKGGYEESAFFALPKNMSPDARIKLSPKKGTYRVVPKKLSLKEAKAESGGKLGGYFGFPVAIDWSGIIPFKGYELDSSAIKITPTTYNVSILPSSDGAFSHVLSFQTQKLKTEEISVELKPTLPSWVMEATSEDDRNIKVNTAEQSRTFGLKYLLGGVMDAYSLHSNGTLSKLNVSINQK